jgi:taurine dioxygenase
VPPQGANAIILLGYIETDYLWAVHSNRYDYAAVKPEASVAAAKYYEEFFISTVYETEHPLVRVLPSGERSLVLGYFFRRFVGLSQLTWDSMRRFSYRWFEQAA